MRFTDGQNISITFREEVLELFQKHRQLTEKHLEAGGQLFAFLNEGEVLISKATGLRSGDKRGRFFFWANRKKEQEEIKSLHDERYHYVGDWHTHPEAIPKPSQIDTENFADCYKQSNHQLKYFIMAIVGISPFPEGLSISAHNEQSIIFLKCI